MCSSRFVFSRWTLVLPRKLASVRRLGLSVEHLSTWLQRSSSIRVMMYLQTTGLWASWCMSCWQAGEDTIRGGNSAVSQCSCPVSNTVSMCLQSSFLRSRSHENLQHHLERHWHDRVPQEDHQECCKSDQEALQVGGTVCPKFTAESQCIFSPWKCSCQQRQSLRETGEPEKWS